MYINKTDSNLFFKKGIDELLKSNNLKKRKYSVILLVYTANPNFLKIIWIAI